MSGATKVQTWIDAHGVLHVRKPSALPAAAAREPWLAETQTGEVVLLAPIDIACAWIPVCPVFDDPYPPLATQRRELACMVSQDDVVRAVLDTLHPAPMRTSVRTYWLALLAAAAAPALEEPLARAIAAHPWPCTRQPPANVPMRELLPSFIRDASTAGRETQYFAEVAERQWCRRVLRMRMQHLAELRETLNVEQLVARVAPEDRGGCCRRTAGVVDLEDLFTPKGGYQVPPCMRDIYQRVVAPAGAAVRHVGHYERFFFLQEARALGAGEAALAAVVASPAARSRKRAHNPNSEAQAPPGSSGRGFYVVKCAHVRTSAPHTCPFTEDVSSAWCYSAERTIASKFGKRRAELEK